MKADDDKIREPLTLVRGREVALDPSWAEIEAIVPTEALVKMIRGKPCKQCVAEERQEIKQAFFFAPVSVTGKQDRYFGLVGLCGEHVLLFIRGLDARGRTGDRGVYCAGRAALPLTVPGMRKEEGPAAFRLIKCMECRRGSSGRQADLFFAVTEDLDEHPFASGKEVFITGYCFKHTERLFRSA